MKQCIKTIIGSMLILTLLCQLLPGNKYSAYVRFHTGLLILLIAAAPILNLFTHEISIEQFLRLQFLQEDFTELQTQLDTFSEMKNQQIIETGQIKYRTQLSEVLRLFDSEATMDISFRTDEPYLPARISIYGKNKEALQQAKKELCEKYQLPDQIITYMLE